MKRFKPKAIWIICILSFIAAFWVNEFNLDHLPASLIRENSTIITNDDASYLRPAENYLATGIWKDNGNTMQSHFIRPPGYGWFYMSCIKIAGKSNALNLLKFIQLLLFSCSVYWIFYIANILFKSKRTVYLATILYGFLPFTSGFLYYTLSEGITPALLILYVFLLFKAQQVSILRTKQLYYLMASLVLAYLLIIRPQLGLFGTLLPLFLIRDYLKYGVGKTILKIAVFSLIGLSFTIGWQVRNYNLTGEYVGIHSIYYADNNSIYRQPLQEQFNFVGGWGQEGAETYEYMLPMWQAAIKGNTSQHFVDAAIKTYPKKVIDFFGYEKLSNVLKNYQAASLNQKPFYEQNLPMPLKTTVIEQELINEMKILTNEFKSKFWMNYYFIAPAKIFKVMAFHSNLSHYIFQHTYRGTLFVEALRILCFALHSLVFIALLLSLLFLKQMDWRMAIINIICLIYVFYLCYFQRGIEERYTLPILPLLIIGIFNTGSIVLSRLRR